MKNRFAKMLAATCIAALSLAQGVWAQMENNVPYLDENGDSQTINNNNVKLITSENIATIDNLSGWFLVRGNLTRNTTLTVSGDTYIILENGSDLTVMINVLEGNSLTIYAQSVDESKGKLTATVDAGIGGTITITGGAVTVTVTGGPSSSSGTSSSSSDTSSGSSSASSSSSGTSSSSSASSSSSGTSSSSSASSSSSGTSSSSDTSSGSGTSSSSSSASSSSSGTSSSSSASSSSSDTSSSSNGTSSSSNGISSSSSNVSSSSELLFTCQLSDGCIRTTVLDCLAEGGSIVPICQNRSSSINLDSLLNLMAELENLNDSLKAENEKLNDSLDGSLSCVPFDLIVVKRWENTLSVIDPEKTYSTYAWYRNGKPIGDGQWWSAGSKGEKIPAGFYRVGLITKDGKVLESCPEYINGPPETQTLNKTTTNATYDAAGRLVTGKSGYKVLLRKAK